MENKKIDEIGEKLDVSSSVIKLKKSPKRFKKLSFWMIHFTNFVLSSLMGLIVGLNAMKYDPPNYPYNTYNDIVHFRVLSINAVNGIITILPKKKIFNLNRMGRIWIAFLNYIISLTISLVIYNYIILAPPPPTLTIVPAYSAYKSPVGIKIQKKIIDTKLMVYQYSIINLGKKR